MALTLLEAAKHHSGDTYRQGVIETIGYEGTVLGSLPFINIAGGAYTYLQEQALGGIDYRGFNESYDEDTGIVSEAVEKIQPFGGNIDVDRAIVKTNGMDVRDSYEQMKLKAMGLKFNRLFIKGDTDSDPRGINGLQKRIVNGQIIEAGATAGGDPLSLAKLDEVIDACQGANALLMNKAMRRRLTAASRTTGVGGFITYEQDEFGRKVTMYGDLPILLIDEDETGAQILPFTEVSGNGGAAQCTSIYAVAFGEDGVAGIQNGDPEVTDMGLLDSASAYRTNVEWLNGMGIMRPKAASRLRGITNAAAVV